MSDRREKFRRAVQDGADEQGVTLSEEEERLAVDFLDDLIPDDVEVLDDLDDLFGPEPRP